MKTWDNAINIIDAYLSQKLSNHNFIKTNANKFANSMLSQMEELAKKSEIPESEVIRHRAKCSESAIKNALYYINKGEDVTLFVGSYGNEYSRRWITHVWIEHNGTISQTNLPNIPNARLYKKAQVKLPKDVDEARSKILSFLSRWK